MKIYTIALFLFAGLGALSCSSQEAEARKVADTAFEKENWVGAEKAYVAYSRRMPPPKDINDALVKVAECRMRMGDTNGALRALGPVFSSKREPDALAAAYALQHGIHAKTPAKANDRARFIGDFRKRLPNHPQLLKVYESEADALVSHGKIAEAMRYYTLAGDALSARGKRLFSLFSQHVSITPPPLSEGDVQTLWHIMESCPDMVPPLCDALAKRKEGWRAEEVRSIWFEAQQRYAEMRATLERLIRQKEGPLDLFALRVAYLTALREGKPEGVALYKEWFRSYPNSLLTGEATCQYAEALILARNPEECVKVLEPFLSSPRGHLEEQARVLLSRAKGDIVQKQNAVAMAETAARAKAADPLLAVFEKAWALHDAQKYQEAVQALTPFSGQESRPLWGKAFFLKGQCLRELGQSEKAVEVWTTVMRNAVLFTNTQGVAECRFGIARVRLEDFGEAEKALPEYRAFHEALPSEKRTPAWEKEYASALLTGECYGEARPFILKLLEVAEQNQSPEILELTALLALCDTEGKLLIKTSLPYSMQRKLRAADVLFASGKWQKANMLYSSITGALFDIEDVAYIAQQRARCLARLGQYNEALRYYNKFAKEYRHTSLADDALIRTAVLYAGVFENPREAMRILESVVRESAEKPSAEVALLYLATLSWWTKQWAEAEKFHMAFLEKYPEHPFRQEILNVRLPAIAKKEVI